MRKDWDTLRLCDRFFDAIEQKDFATVESCYAPEAIVWHSHDCLYQSRESQPDDAEGRHAALQEDALPRTGACTSSRAASSSSTRSFVTHPNDFVGQMDVCFVGLHARRHDLARLRVLRHGADREVPGAARAEAGERLKAGAPDDQARSAGPGMKRLGVGGEAGSRLASVPGFLSPETDMGRFPF